MVKDKKASEDIGKIALAAFESLKGVCPDARLEGSRIMLPDGQDIEVGIPRSGLNGHLCVYGMGESLPSQVRNWIIVGVMNAGRYVKYDKMSGTLNVYDRWEKVL